MKKVFLIMLCLFLTACSTGGGVVSDNLTPEQRAAVISNARVTGMLTYLETDASGNTLVSRGATSGRSDSAVGTFNLSDVKFAIADEGFDTEGFTFVVDDNGKITGIDMGFGGEEGYPEDGPEYLERDGETADFNGLVNDDENHGGDRSHWKQAVYTYNSLGKEYGLRYSDFGHINIATEGREFWRPTFIGGYDDGKKIETNEITGLTQETTFSGHVTGHVMSVKEGDGSGQALPLDADATLTFTPGDGVPTSVMAADFGNWYNMEYTENGDNKSVRFWDYSNPDDENDTFRLTSDTQTGDVYASDTENGLLLDNTVTWTDDDETVNRLNSEVRYFGENGTPTEAVGLIQLRDCNGGECTGHYDETPEVRMNISFGVK